MDAERQHADEPGADGFEFNLTRVLETLETRSTTLSDLSALAAPEPAPTDASAGVAPSSPFPAAPLVPPAAPPEPEPLPTRVPTQRARGPQQTRPAARPAPEPAAPAPAPAPLPTRTAAARKPDLVPPGRRSVFDEAATGEARAALHRVPADTNVAVAALETPLLPMPTLPPAAPTPPPEAAAATVAAAMPTAADVRQFQSAQRRHARKSRQGRVMGRVMLVLALFTAAVALALTVGREYLFPPGWADELAPLVAEIEASQGASFDGVLALTEQPADDYASTVSRAVLGDDPATRIELWRALGIATGEVDAAAVGAALAPLHLAVYDPGSDSIVRLAGSAADLRPALAAALAAQRTGTDSSASIAVLGPVPAPPAPAAPPVSAADLAPAGPLTPPVGAIAAAEQVVADFQQNAPPADVTAAALGDSVLPIAYQLAAVDRATSAAAAGPQPVAPEAALAAGDSPLVGPVSLSLDDWTLVWANRLPADSVDTLRAATVANSVRTFDRAGVTCAGAVFEAGNELFAAALLSDLGRWAAAAPAEAQTTVTQIAPTYVQLVACDPGPAVAQSLDRAAVDLVVTRQGG